MYHALLTRKYLTSKVMPLLASLAVALCVAMVLITWSVMGGFLQTLLDSGRKVVGDVVIQWPNTGFAHYEDLVERLEATDEVAAAAPIIESFGVVTLPDDRIVAVQVKGIEGDRFARVTDYEESVYWRPIDTPLRYDDAREDPRLGRSDLWNRLYDEAMSLTTTRGGEGARPAAVLGIELTGFNERQRGGWYVPMDPVRALPDGGYEVVETFMPLTGRITLNVLPLDEQGRAVEMSTRVIPVVNEFRSGIYDVDQRTVFVRLDLLQRMLNMDEARRVTGDPGTDDPFTPIIDPETGEMTWAEPDLEVDPSRVTTVLIRGRDDVPVDQVARLARQIYREFAQAHPGQVPIPELIQIKTWEDLNAQFIGAVKRETALVLFIFSFISMTAVFLILAIFWAMVREKTKDIGILRSLGASRRGVASLWLGYGLAIGLVGAGAGGLLAWAVVRNINAIHDWMGETLNLYVWDPSVYYFTSIPNELDAAKAAWVLSGALLCSVLGALLPAIAAARMDPVRSLRFE